MNYECDIVKFKYVNINKMMMYRWLVYTSFALSKELRLDEIKNV